MENEMETREYMGIILYWDSIGIMGKKMETTTLYRGYIGVTLGLYRNSGKGYGGYCFGSWVFLDRV